MFICIVLLGASINLITNNINQIVLLLNGIRNQTNSVSFYYFTFILMILFLLCFVFIWIIALTRARQSLKTALITRCEPINLSALAISKCDYCHRAIDIIIVGTLALAILIIIIASILMNINVLTILPLVGLVTGVIAFICIQVLKYKQDKTHTKKLHRTQRDQLFQNSR